MPFLIEELSDADAGTTKLTLSGCCRSDSFVIEELGDSEAVSGDGAVLTSLSGCCRSEKYSI